METIKPRSLTDADVEAIAQRVVALLERPNGTAAGVRNTYSCEQFSAEILGGNRLPKWVRKQCRLGKIKTVGRMPWIIPQSEAARFAGMK